MDLTLVWLSNHTMGHKKAAGHVMRAPNEMFQSREKEE